ncbi:hypothetical protein Dsin_013411 [Dipteronia sinensis]|uniref:TF-B3 domain-containing protein n=1 Tax=Dipteronia sinensis TaxID=43782 RepID=A0AAE0E8Z2_9ROSI|nr:hypothetical protein Dsin_013411 [Dipteronia sinensis]
MAMEETPQHFFKVILASTLEEKKLRIPEKFVRKFRDELLAVAAITTPDGQVWQVGLLKEGGKIWFHHGLQDFIEYYSICVGYFLVFEYEKKSNFHVTIFDTSTFEISYPYNFEEPKKEENLIHKKEDYRNQQGASNLDRSSNKCKMEEQVEVNTNTAHDGEDEHPTQIKGVNELKVLLEDKGIFLSRNYNFSSVKEIKRLFNLARSLKPRNPSFMIMLRPSHLYSRVMMISKKFVRIFGNELSTAATLTVPNGRVLKVGLIRDGRTIWFRDGWHDFVQYNSISAGYFLVFKYGGNSNFNVLIFDLTACEIEYPYYGKESENDRHNLSRQDESENEDSVEIIDVTTPNPTFESPKNKAFDKCPRSSSLMPSHLNRANKPSFVPALGVDKNQERGYESQNKRRKMEELVGSNQSNAVGSDINLKKTAYEVGTHSSYDAAKFDGDEFVDLLDNMGICVNKRFGNIAFEERERAIAAARLFKPKNPSFMVIWRSTENHRLYVPAKFARKYFSTSTKSIKVLDSDGRKWSVLLTSVPTCFMTKLGRFGKKLDGGDICVFELISRKILKVSVLKIRDVVKEGGSKQTSNVMVEEEAANNRNKDEKKSSENEGGSNKRVVVKEGVSKDNRNVMVEEAAAINEGGSNKMSTAKSGGFERTTVQPERVGVSKLVQPRNPYFIVKLRTRTKKHLLLVPTKILKDHKLDLPWPVFFRNEQGMKSPGNAFVWNDGRTWISGWKDFCTQNSVGLDDHCICEFLPDCNGQMGDTIQVHIIRNASSGS